MHFLTGSWFSQRVCPRAAGGRYGRGAGPQLAMLERKQTLYLKLYVRSILRTGITQTFFVTIEV